MLSSGLWIVSGLALLRRGGLRPRIPPMPRWLDGNPATMTLAALDDINFLLAHPTGQAIDAHPLFGMHCGHTVDGNKTRQAPSTSMWLAETG